MKTAGDDIPEVLRELVEQAGDIFLCQNMLFRYLWSLNKFNCHLSKRQDVILQQRIIYNHACMHHDKHKVLKLKDHAYIVT